MSRRESWDVDGSGRMTDEQRRMLNAICGDLSRQVSWHGNKLSKDDWRHLLAGTLLGWRLMPGIDRGEGAPGFVMLGGSSLSLSKSLAKDAITCGLAIGDDPSSQGLSSPPVRWSDAVLLGLGFNPAEMAA
jgi:hypothetical protein